MPSWSNTPSGTMTACVLSKLGAPATEAFTIQTDYPRPTLPSPSWVLVRVHMAGMNRSDLRARIDEYLVPREFGIFEDEYQPVSPKVIGEEFVGEVEEAGSATDFKKGERVAGFIYGGGKAFDGSYANYTICPAERCWKLGEDALSLPWETLGAIPMSMWAAYGSLFVGGDTKPGDSVLVHGATSAVGVWCILLAKERGCTVVASTRQPGKVQKLKDLGADHVLLEDDLVKHGLRRNLCPDGVNTVIELVGVSTWTTVGLPALAFRGTLVNMGILNLQWQTDIFHAAAIPNQRRITSYTLAVEDVPLSRDVLIDVVSKVKKGIWRQEQFLDSVFDIQDVAQAHIHMEQNKAVGKVLLRLP
ncbi:uncharacterized protein Z518_04625 [Rhinocladiella mackenziei CBS 650.93]|uniref:Enoyl reductase (ER) domain-containing protein n=1 Tax=Rhinocladiella mackenziei CBS 650.93 TaxID=1442369 RepID=A0A0D2ILM3_9EURO|nr:uncharacterized protein Z518_04625 [Rhinocladiella mackenziei CBS 650.93]KIX06649.1 hypothetical protein Z518_04625 [Rhinocladiella mackenziei CBS 650.93]